MSNPKRFIQIYTGNGKGKTTAALGQIVRAAGSRLTSCLIMFMKDYPYGELRALKGLEEFVTIHRFGNDAFVFRKEPPGKADLDAARTGLETAREAMMSGTYDLVVLDEICVCTYFKLLTAADVLPLLTAKPSGVELILTGRYCPPEWIEVADLVTDMREVKHYYQQGVLSRKGFES